MATKQPTTETPKTTAKTDDVKPAANPSSAAPAAPAAAATNKKNTKTVLIVVAIVVFIFIILPAILFTVGALVIGKKLADNGVSVDSSSKSVTVKDKNGNQFSAGGTQQLPADFPSNVPVYSKNVVASGRTTIDGKTAWTVSVQTNDSPATITNNLKNAFSNNGWSISNQSTTNDGGYITASNGTHNVNIFYGTDNGKTTLLYTVSAVTTE
jgi:hypothetical protein